MKVKDYLVRESSFIRISEIEKVIGCPVTSIQKWIKYDRTLSKEWEDKVEIFCKEHFNYGNDNSILIDNAVWLKKEKKGELKEIVVNDKMEIQSEKVKEIPILPVKIDMSTVDISTGEIKEKLVPVRLKWSFNREDGFNNVSEVWIKNNGKIFEVEKIFGRMAKYTYVDNLEDARRIVKAKNPLLVELSK